MTFIPPNDVVLYGKDDLPILTRGNLRVEWTNLGEGRHELYDPNEPSDVNFLRLDVTERQPNGQFEAPDGAECSVCTAITAAATKDQQIECLILAMDKLEPVYERTDFYNLKGTIDTLSWMDLGWLKTKPVTKAPVVINSAALAGLMGRLGIGD